jgi:hypothetical protein
MKDKSHILQELFFPLNLFYQLFFNPKVILWTRLDGLRGDNYLVTLDFTISAVVTQSNNTVLLRAISFQFCTRVGGCWRTIRNWRIEPK